MKKLQILMLMSLAIGSSLIYTSQTKKQQDQAEAIQSQLNSTLDQQASLEVLGLLSQSNPEVVELIIEDEESLDSNFNSIKKFIDKKNKEIAKLSLNESVKDTEIARLAVELVNAQAMFEKYIAEQRAKNKTNPSREQDIIDALKAAGQKLRSFNEKAMDSLSELGNAAKKSVKSIEGQINKQVKKHRNKLISSKDQNVDAGAQQDESDSSDVVVVQRKKKK